jgi:hypothetical protein
VRGRSIAVRGFASVLASSLLAVAAVVADAVSGEARLGLIGIVLLALALAITLTQAVRARVGRLWRMTRLAARAGTASSLFVATFLACVGVLERMGPEVMGSTVVTAGVAVMSVLLLVALPLALVVFGWGVWKDRRLSGRMRVLPWTLLVIVAVGAVALAVTDGSQELWLQAAAAAVAGATLTGFSAGLSRRSSAGPGPSRGEPATVLRECSPASTRTLSLSRGSEPPEWVCTVTPAAGPDAAR